MIAGDAFFRQLRMQPRIPSKNKDLFPFLRITTTCVSPVTPTGKISTINRQFVLEHPLSATHTTYQCSRMKQEGPESLDRTYPGTLYTG